MLGDAVHETMLREEGMALHATCAEVLEGMVEDSRIAAHHEAARHFERAAAIFIDVAKAVRAEMSDFIVRQLAAEARLKVG